jgi:imidazole glycerol-phosphate synthase subunit HisH
VPRVVVLDYGSGNLRSAQRAVARTGAEVVVTPDLDAAADADGLVVPGVGAFAACMAGIDAVGAGPVIAARVAQGRPVLGICVGMQVLFEYGEEHGVVTKGLGLLPGGVTRLRAERIPHMGWNTVTAPEGSRLFAGVEPGARFYFVHSYAPMPAQGRSTSGWAASAGGSASAGGLVAMTVHGGEFVAAVEHGPLWATQFHPEKSGDAGAVLLRNWVRELT